MGWGCAAFHWARACGAAEPRCASGRAGARCMCAAGEVHGGRSAVAARLSCRAGVIAVKRLELSKKEINTCGDVDEGCLVEW